MKGISKKILFVGLGLALAQPISTRPAVPSRFQTTFTRLLNLWRPFSEKAKIVATRAVGGATAYYAGEDIFFSENPKFLGQTARNLGISPLVEIPKSDSSATEILPTVDTSSSTVTIWDILQTMRGPKKNCRESMQKMLNIQPGFSEEQEEKFLANLKAAVNENPLSRAKNIIVAAPIADQKVKDILGDLKNPIPVSSLASTSVKPSIPLVVPKPTGITPPLPPAAVPLAAALSPAKAEISWGEYLTPSIIYNNPKASAVIYIVSGLLILPAYKKLKLASYSARFCKHLADEALLWDPKALNECITMMQQYDPIEYPATRPINKQMATNFINQLSHQDMSSGYLKIIFPFHTALFRILRYAGSIA